MTDVQEYEAPPDIGRAVGLVFAGIVIIGTYFASTGVSFWANLATTFQTQPGQLLQSIGQLPAAHLLWAGSVVLALLALAGGLAEGRHWLRFRRASVIDQAVVLDRQVEKNAETPRYWVIYRFMSAAPTAPGVVTTLRQPVPPALHATLVPGTQIPVRYAPYRLRVATLIVTEHDTSSE